MSAAAPPRFLFAGESALVVEYGDRIDPAIHDRVLALDRAVAAAAIPGLRETVPTYRSLLIDYDPELIAPDALIERLRGLPIGAEQAKARPRRWIVPACYDPTLALDLGYVAQKQGLTPEKLVALHSGAIYRLYMYGFAPGFAYLGGLPKASRYLAPDRATTHVAAQLPADRRWPGADHHRRHADRLAYHRAHTGALFRSRPRTCLPRRRGR